MCFIWKGGGRPLKRRALHSILAGYNVTTRVTSDTEWVRIVISDAEFDWFFSPRGRDCDFRWIVAHRAIDWRTGHLHETNLSSLAMSWTSQGAFFWSDVPQTEKGIHIETWLRWHIQKLNAWEPFNSMTVNQEYSSLNMWRKPVKKGLSTHHWPFIDEPPNE